MTLRSAVISLVLFELVNICGVVLIYFYFKPEFTPALDDLHIGYAITTVIFCIGLMILWIVWIDKRINKNG